MNAEQEQQAKEKWLDVPPPSFCNGKRHLSIFDFDGTLFPTHERAEGEILYFMEKGVEWPYAGWYGRPETLQAPFVPDPVPQEFLIPEVHQDFRRVRADPEQYVVLLTGRPLKLRRRIREIFAAFGLVFDEEYYKGMKGISREQDTFDYKADIIENRLAHPKLETVQIWEDRAEHVGRFTAFPVGTNTVNPILWDSGYSLCRRAL
jgi:hypothetical protein